MKALDFTRQHLAEWPTEPWAQLAHETWQDYDAQATFRERWWGRYGRLHAPRMSNAGLPPEAQGGFHRLFDWIVRESYETAQGLGFTGSPADWRERVKNEGKRHA